MNTPGHPQWRLHGQNDRPKDVLVGLPGAQCVLGASTARQTGGLGSGGDKAKMMDPYLHSWLLDGDDALLGVIRSALVPPHLLTYAAEAAGYVQDHDAARVALLPLLDHHSQVVREGAIYGISEHMNETVREKLRLLAQADPSPGVRAAASAYAAEEGNCND